jgi:hypothetical protein
MRGLEWRGDPAGMEHDIFLFQEGVNPERTLDLRIWFRDIELRRPDGVMVPVEDVISGGVRWWEALHAGDERTQGHGISPVKPKG